MYICIIFSLSKCTEKYVQGQVEVRKEILIYLNNKKVKQPHIEGNGYNQQEFST